jgi:1-acyl-sn-glycerol-3-phosphate acyltransferase
VQNIIIDKPYQFVPPHRSRFWPAVLDLYLPRYLEKSHGVVKVECRGTEKLKASLAAGHGVLLAPNHSRPCDPMVLGALSRAVSRHFFIMASWHLFMQDRASRWLLRRAGAFSVHREGNDKSALSAAMDILVDAKRPLIIFPEGIVSRTNDYLNPLMEGTAFIARGAAKKRSKDNPSAKVVIHPISINYFYRGDIRKAAAPVLHDIERRLTWRPNAEMELIERLYKIGGALLSLKEIEFFGNPQSGPIRERVPKLIDRLLAPLEKEWREGKADTHVIARVKKLRQAILPEMAKSSVSKTERERRWRHLADIYLAQQLDFYRPDYVRSNPTPERILETIERFEEDLTDKARTHRPIVALIEAGDPIEVNPDRDRAATVDPVMKALEDQLTGMLKRNSAANTAPISD